MVLRYAAFPDSLCKFGRRTVPYRTDRSRETKKNRNMETRKSIIKASAALLLALGATSIDMIARDYELRSPDGQLCLKISAEEQLTWSLRHEDDLMIADSPISMTLTDGTVLGRGKERPRVRKSSADELIRTVIYRKDEVRDHYNQLTLSYRKFDLVFRAYDSGAAYRFLLKPAGIQASDKASSEAAGISEEGKIRIASEEATFRFPEDWTAYIPYVRNFDAGHPEAQFNNSFENTYSHIHLSEWTEDRIAFLPLLVEGPDGKKIEITEADLQDYPGMFLQLDRTSENGAEVLEQPSAGQTSQLLIGVFAPLPDLVEQGGHNNLQGMVKTRKPYIAEYNTLTEDLSAAESLAEGRLRFPWRIVAVSEEDRELADNDLVYCLAEPQDPELDFSWVRPGKVAWDWWNDWNLYGVDFRAGINNETYKYFIDFASSHGIPYVILDEGWAVKGEADLLQVIPEIDLQLLIDYGKSKDVGIILWAGYWALQRDVEGLCRHFSEMGVKGFKVDFMDRDDQYMTRFLAETAEIAARYHLILDFHGTHKPTGLQRTWPNAINFEGVHGLEQMKWCGAETDQVTYDVTIPFIRMFAGPFDYTQGAMRNATRGNYRPVYNEPMSQGTRCRQLAEYIIFESPLNMLCDSPSNYMAEPECTRFIARVPETWNRTEVLDGAVGKYIVIAREKDHDWYIGAMTDWNERDITVDLSFIGSNSYHVEIFRDGPNADRAAKDYRHEQLLFPEDGKIQLHLAPGGGAVIHLTELK